MAKMTNSYKKSVDQVAIVRSVQHDFEKNINEKLVDLVRENIHNNYKFKNIKYHVDADGYDVAMIIYAIDMNVEYEFEA